MEHFRFSKKGFTLVEMLIAMAIFVSFTGVLIGSYTSIVSAQREANEYRVMYSEARKVFETLILELRDSMIDYRQYVYGGDIFFVSKDGGKQTEVSYDQEKITLNYSYLENVDNTQGAFAVIYGKNPKSITLNDPSLVKVTDFKVYVNPVLDPYDPVNVEKDNIQFHPKVTIFATFKREFLDGKSYEMDLQTSVSSRVYNQIVPSVNSAKL